MAGCSRARRFRIGIRFLVVVVVGVGAVSLGGGFRQLIGVMVLRSLGIGFGFVLGVECLNRFALKLRVGVLIAETVVGWVRFRTTDPPD